MVYRWGVMLITLDIVFFFFGVGIAESLGLITVDCVVLLSIGS